MESGNKTGLVAAMGKLQHRCQDSLEPSRHVVNMNVTPRCGRCAVSPSLPPRSDMDPRRQLTVVERYQLHPYRSRAMSSIKARSCRTLIMTLHPSHSTLNHSLPASSCSIIMKFFTGLAFASLALAAPTAEKRAPTPLNVKLELEGNSKVKATLTNNGKSNLKVLKSGTLLDSSAVEKAQVFSESMLLFCVQSQKGFRLTNI